MDENIFERVTGEIKDTVSAMKPGRRYDVEDVPWWKSKIEEMLCSGRKDL
jgi:hypothetical protein